MPSTEKIFKGGVHPLEGKELSNSTPIQEAPLLEEYTVILQQHIGAPPKLLVENGEEVKKGQMIAKKGGFVSAPIHSPTSGRIKLTEALSPSSSKLPACNIIADGNDEWIKEKEEQTTLENLSSEEIKQKIDNAGIVGMGGASFPTAVKLSPPTEKEIDTLVINGAECEPFLTADHRLMLENSEGILQGIHILSKVLDVNNILFGIEENKEDVIEKLSSLIKDNNYNINIIPLKVKYPQGAEKQLIYSLTGREVPLGGLPMDVKSVVQNVGTAFAVKEAVLDNKPLIDRVTTVTGSPVKNPGNWKFRIGTPLNKALELAGGVKEDPAKIIMGGPMMGQTQYSLDVPVMKNTSGILLLSKNEISQYSSNPCIRCGRCIEACPMSLMPGTLSQVIENENFSWAEYNNIMDCMECGACTYVCPAFRPIIQHIKRGKSEVIEKRKNSKKQ